jgi:hypothetical protein
MTPERERRRAHVRAVVLGRLERLGREELRREALSEFFTVTLGADPGTARRTAALVPPLMDELHARWVDLFAERLLETVPGEQLDVLCAGGAENDATLCLVYVMFLESARMEERRERDLLEYAARMSGADDAGDLAASYIRARMARLGAALKAPDGE